MVFCKRHRLANLDALIQSIELVQEIVYNQAGLVVLVANYPARSKIVLQFLNMELKVDCVGLILFQPVVDLSMASVILINYLARHDPLEC